MAAASLLLKTHPTAVDAVEIWQLYDAVFHDHPSFDAWKSAWDRHCRRDGYRLARAYDDERLVGFAYGYTGQRGQWWTDNAERVLDQEIAARWLGNHFEIVDLAVHPSSRRRGLGRQLVRSLTRGLPHERLLLMATADESDPARRLYRSEGWCVLGPGIGDSTVILGKSRS